MQLEVAGTGRGKPRRQKGLKSRKGDVLIPGWGMAQSLGSWLKWHAWLSSCRGILRGFTLDWVH